jgi:hypothetical protein
VVREDKAVAVALRQFAALEKQEEKERAAAVAERRLAALEKQEEKVRSIRQHTSA